jgi:hypothetical protein
MIFVYLLLIILVYDIGYELQSQVTMHYTMKNNQRLFVSRTRTSMASLNPNNVSPVTASLCDDTNFL